MEGDTLIDMITEDLVAERIAIDSYREMINYLGMTIQPRAGCWKVFWQWKKSMPTTW